MKDLIKELDRVLRGKDTPKTKPKVKVNEKDETYKDMFREVYEQDDYPDDDDDETSEPDGDDDDDEFAIPSESEQEKKDPSYKQDVSLIKMMLTNKLKERLTELRGKTKK